MTFIPPPPRLTHEEFCRRYDELRREDKPITMENIDPSRYKWKKMVTIPTWHCGVLYVGGNIAGFLHDLLVDAMNYPADLPDIFKLVSAAMGPGPEIPLNKMSQMILMDAWQETFVTRNERWNFLDSEPNWKMCLQSRRPPAFVVFPDGVESHGEPYDFDTMAKYFNTMLTSKKYDVDRLWYLCIFYCRIFLNTFGGEKMPYCSGDKSSDIAIFCGWARRNSEKFRLELE